MNDPEFEVEYYPPERPDHLLIVKFKDKDAALAFAEENGGHAYRREVVAALSKQFTHWRSVHISR